MSRTLICLFVVILLTLSSQAIVLRSFTNQIVVNDSIPGQQRISYVYMLDNEYIVVAWYDQNVPTKIFFQIFDPVGVKIGNNKGGFETTTYARNFVTMLPGGKFALAIFSSSSLPTIYIYNYLGNLVAGPFTVSNVVASSITTINIAKLDDGNVAITWFSSSSNTINVVIMKIDGTKINEFNFTSANTKCGLVLESVDQNKFAMCWTNTVSTDIICRIYNTDGQNLIEFIPHQMAQCGAGYSMMLRRLLNNHIVLGYTYWPGSYKQYIYVFDLNGNMILGPTEVNSSDIQAKTHPNIALLSTGNFMFIYDYDTLTQSYIQEFSPSSNYTPVGNRFIVNTASGSLLSSYLHVTGLKRGGYACSYNAYTSLGAADFDIYLQVYYADESVTCSDLTITMKAQSQYSLTENFNNSITDDYMPAVKVRLYNVPSSGGFKTESGTAITTDPTSISSFYFASVTSGAFVFQYSAIDYYNNESTLCKLNINVCYESCETCVSVGNETNHLCTRCRATYLNMGNGNCYENCPVELTGKYYYNDVSTNTCKECSSPCQKCTAANKCTTCAIGFIKVDNLETDNCVSSCPAGYYSSGGSCVACHPLCSSCSGLSSNCSACISTAFLMPPNQCVSECPLGYGVNSSGQCVSCKSMNKYLYQNACVDSCPKGISNATLNLCNDIDIAPPSGIFSFIISTDL
jgi:hypothetical protein